MSSSVFFFIWNSYYNAGYATYHYNAGIEKVVDAVFVAVAVLCLIIYFVKKSYSTIFHKIYMVFRYFTFLFIFKYNRFILTVFKLITFVYVFLRILNSKTKQYFSQSLTTQLITLFFLILWVYWSYVFYKMLEWR